MWTNSEEKNQAFNKGVALMILFCPSTLLLLISLTKTIMTSPGGIPEQMEWDMQSDSESDTVESEEDEIKEA